jgi:small subunit ribosomal protein S2
MRPYIFTERNGIHIIDIQQTVERLETATELIREDISNGGMLLFVGTKKQAQENIAAAAERCRMPYVNERWLGGTLTNFRTIRQRIDYLVDLEQRLERGEFQTMTKKEVLDLERKMSKLNQRLGGIRRMDRLPSLVFIADVRREQIAVKEANKLGIPIIAMVDTNCDPDAIDYVIPANDDAIRSIKLISSKLADAVIDGQQVRAALLAEEAEEAEGSAEDWGEYAEDEGVPAAVEELARERPAPYDEVDKDDVKGAEEHAATDRGESAQLGAEYENAEQADEGE